MRNYDNEIKELLEDIEELKITRKSKETQLKLVREDQRESIKNKKITILTNDHDTGRKSRSRNTNATGDGN